jgi:hypothetical protein
MNRVAIGAMCFAVCVFSILNTGRNRRALGAVALETMERLFDFVESALHLA